MKGNKTSPVNPSSAQFPSPKEVQKAEKQARIAENKARLEDLRRRVLEAVKESGGREFHFQVGHGYATSPPPEHKLPKAILNELRASGWKFRYVSRLVVGSLAGSDYRSYRYEITPA